jgi:hypothetical protein
MKNSTDHRLMLLTVEEAALCTVALRMLRHRRNESDNLAARIERACLRGRRAPVSKASQEVSDASK